MLGSYRRVRRALPVVRHRRPGRGRGCGRDGARPWPTRRRSLVGPGWLRHCRREPCRAPGVWRFHFWRGLLQFEPPALAGVVGGIGLTRPNGIRSVTARRTIASAMVTFVSKATVSSMPDRPPAPLPVAGPRRGRTDALLRNAGVIGDQNGISGLRGARRRSRGRRPGPRRRPTRSGSVTGGCDRDPLARSAPQVSSPPSAPAERPVHPSAHDLASARFPPMTTPMVEPAGGHDGRRCRTKPSETQACGSADGAFGRYTVIWVFKLAVRPDSLESFR